MNIRGFSIREETILRSVFVNLKLLKVNSEYWRRFCNVSDKIDHLL